MWTRGFVLLFCGMLLAGTGWIDRCYGQVTRSGTKLTSEQSSSPPSGLVSEVAAALILSAPTSSVGVRIFGGPFGNSNVPAFFNVRVYDDAGQIPDQMLYEYLRMSPVVSIATLDPIDSNQIYRYDFTIAHPFLDGIYYWISLQAWDHPIPDQWGVQMTTLVTALPAMFKSAYFNFPDWLPASLVPVPEDVHMEITDGNPVPTRLSTWGSVKALYRN